MAQIHQIDELRTRKAHERKQEMTQILDNLQRMKDRVVERKALYKSADAAMENGSMQDMLKARDALAAKIAEKKRRLAS